MRLSIARISAETATLPGGVELAGEVAFEDVVIDTGDDAGDSVATTREADDDREDEESDGSGLPQISTTCPECGATWTYHEATSTQTTGDVTTYQCPECSQWQRGPGPLS